MLMAQQLPDLLIDGPKRATRTIVLAHGAGAGMDTLFMNFFAEGLAERGLRVVRFEFRTWRSVERPARVDRLIGCLFSESRGWR